MNNNNFVLFIEYFYVFAGVLGLYIVSKNLCKVNRKLREDENNEL